MAKKKKIQTIDLAGLDTSFEDIGGNAPTYEIVEFIKSKSRKAGQKFEGNVADITAKVVELLSKEAKVL